MARSPDWKVYDAEKNYQAACKEPTTAAAVVSLLGIGATIRYGHNQVVWKEGDELILAGESYDIVAETCFSRANRQETNSRRK
jgi:hypothetical protein